MINLIFYYHCVSSIEIDIFFHFGEKNEFTIIPQHYYKLPQFGIRIVHKKVGSLTNILYLYR